MGYIGFIIILAKLITALGAAYIITPNKTKKKLYNFIQSLEK